MEGLNEKAKKNQRLLKRSKKLYINDLASQLDTLEQLLTNLSTRFDMEESHHVYRILHKLKGGAPIFGLVRIGKVAEEMLFLWEWTQSRMPVEPVNFSFLKKSENHLLRLKMEYGICLKEMELDEIEEKLGPEFYEAPGHLLIIDDDDSLRAYLCQQFELAGYNVSEAADVATAKRKLRETSFDLILLDLMMYPQSGYELFEFLKEDPTLKWVPLIVLSGREDLEDKVRCLQLGADDYVTKPFHYEELEARVSRMLQRSKQFEEMAFRDALTGVFNRRYFDHQLHLILQLAKRAEQTVSIAFVDIDRFKSVNDTYGHQTGDLVLQGLGHIMGQNLRTTDLLARYGGEEFVILFFETDQKQAEYVMNRVLQAVRDNPVARDGEREYTITFSCGIAQLDSGMTGAQWIQLADAAMYQAKEQGRNRVIVAGGIACEVPAALLTPPEPVENKRLLVMSEQVMFSLLNGKLKTMPVDILRAETLEAAIEILKMHPVDLFLLDDSMAILDGVLVLERIRQEPGLSDVRILLLSARKRDEDAVTVEEYLAKPFSLIELETRVKKIAGLEY